MRKLQELVNDTFWILSSTSNHACELISLFMNKLDATILLQLRKGVKINV